MSPPEIYARAKALLQLSMNTDAAQSAVGLWRQTRFDATTGGTIHVPILQRAAGPVTTVAYFTRNGDLLHRICEDGPGIFTLACAPDAVEMYHAAFEAIIGPRPITNTETLRTISIEFDRAALFAIRAIIDAERERALQAMTEERYKRMLEHGE